MDSKSVNIIALKLYLFEVNFESREYGISVHISKNCKTNEKKIEDPRTSIIGASINSFELIWAERIDSLLLTNYCS